MLETSGVKVRSEPLGGSGGGLCSIKGENIFFVDTQAPSAEVAEQCARAAIKIVDIESVYVRPQVRELLEKYREAGQ